MSIEPSAGLREKSVGLRGDWIGVDGGLVGLRLVADEALLHGYLLVSIFGA